MVELQVLLFRPFGISLSLLLDYASNDQITYDQLCRIGSQIVEPFSRKRICQFVNQIWSLSFINSLCCSGTS